MFPWFYMNMNTNSVDSNKVNTIVFKVVKSWRFSYYSLQIHYDKFVRYFYFTLSATFPPKMMNSSARRTAMKKFISVKYLSSNQILKEVENMVLETLFKVIFRE